MSFDRQVEDMLLVLYEREMSYGLHDGDNVSWSFESVFRAVPGRVDPSLAGTIKTEFVRRGYGKFGNDNDGFRLLPRGEAAAIEILNSRRPKSLPQALRALPWVSIFSLVSAIAAVIAAVPVVREMLR